MSRSRRRAEAGLSYVEVLVATLILAASLVPALDALKAGLDGMRIHEDLARERHHLMSKLEEVLADPFLTLSAVASASPSPTTPTPYSDPVAAADRRLVYVFRYDGDDADGDGDPFTGVDSGLVWVRVAVQGTPHAIETLTSDD